MAAASRPFAAALAELRKSDPVYAIYVTCSECGHKADRVAINLGKRDAAKTFLESGWDYTDEGKWLCPACVHAHSFDND